MPLPEGLQTVTVTATFLGPTGEPLAGTVRFAPQPTNLTVPGEDLVLGGPVTVHLDPSGELTITLVATDAEGVDPTGWTYRVSERFANAPGRDYSIALPSELGTVDLADLAPRAPAAGEYVLVPGPPGPPGPEGAGLVQIARFSWSVAEDGGNAGAHMIGSIPEGAIAVGVIVTADETPDWGGAESIGGIGFTYPWWITEGWTTHVGDVTTTGTDLAISSYEPPATVGALRFAVLYIAGE